MDFKDIKKLVELVEDAQISHLSIDEKGVKIEIKKELAASSTAVVLPQAPAPVAAQPVSEVSTSQPVPDISQVGLLEIKSEMIGTFYDSPNPDSVAFVKVGDRVKKGDVVCILEAMKLFNEIESEVNGVIEKVCVNTGDAIEFGQVLFLVKPE